ncbi:hypothetical protein CRUP_025747, partial [Coryphaenoides rupestris]
NYGRVLPLMAEVQGQDCSVLPLALLEGPARLETPSARRALVAQPRAEQSDTMSLGFLEVTVVYQNGLPVISVSLPSRRERCQFTLKPLSDSQLLVVLACLLSVDCPLVDGARVASSTGIDILLLDDFKLVINDATHLVRPPRRVQQLYTTLRIEEHQLGKERELIGRLEELNTQLGPLEKFGILARLTWWEYSWDIMEPVTYFITYATAMAMYAYFVLTRQGLKRTRFDVDKYNKLKGDIAEVELDLKRLRDPLQLQLPVQQLTASKD